jgi:hypothetical protein
MICSRCNAAYDHDDNTAMMSNHVLNLPNIQPMPCKLPIDAFQGRKRYDYTNLLHCTCMSGERRALRHAIHREIMVPPAKGK